MTESFAARLSRLMTERGLSDRDLAAEIGFSHMSVRRWRFEERSPRLEELEALSRVLDVSLEYLITGREHNPSDPEYATWMRVLLEEAFGPTLARFVSELATLREVSLRLAQRVSDLESGRSPRKK